MNDATRLSRMLWDAREIIDQYALIVKRLTGHDEYLARVRDDIDAYRAERGWSPDGFGGET